MGWVRRLAIVLVGLQLCGWTGFSASSVAWAADSAEVADEHDVHDAGDAHGGGSTNPVTLDPDLAIVTAIVFVVLLLVLGKFAWKPIVASIDRREHTLAEQLAEAKRNQEAARQMLVDHEQRMAGAALEVKQMLDQARHDAEIQKQQILETAQAAAAAEKDRAVREIHVAKNAALQELANKSVETAVDLAGKIVRRQLTSDDHSQLIGEALQQFSHNN
jgi:F-type H+-transporting ATPase subunit b